MNTDKYIKDALERANLQRIREFIMTGGDTNVEEESYENRLEKHSEPILTRLKAIYPDELHEAFCEFNQAVGAYANVYIEIGIKIGTKLSSELSH